MGEASEYHTDWEGSVLKGRSIEPDTDGTEGDGEPQCGENNIDDSEEITEMSDAIHVSDCEVKIEPYTAAKKYATPAIEPVIIGNKITPRFETICPILGYIGSQNNLVHFLKNSFFILPVIFSLAKIASKIILEIYAMVTVIITPYKPICK